MKQVLIINGHSDKESFNYALSEAYIKRANKTNSILTQINIAELEFNPNLNFGYRKRMELETDLVNAIDKIKKADHIVWIFPMCWYGYPALMKVFIERTFLPGITYQPIEGKQLPEKLMKGKSARLIITADAQKWYYFLIMNRPAINQLKKGTLQFYGINPLKVTYIATIKNSSSDFRKKLLEKISLLGENAH